MQMRDFVVRFAGEDPSIGHTSYPPCHRVDSAPQPDGDRLLHGQRIQARVGYLVPPTFISHKWLSPQLA